MSLQTMMIHKCDIIRKSVTAGAAGGHVETETTLSSDVKCRARPLKPEEVALLAKDDVRADYKFYFTADPGVNRRDEIEYIDKNSNTLRLQVVAWYNPHDMDKFWKVFAFTIKDE